MRLYAGTLHSHADCESRCPLLNGTAGPCSLDRIPPVVYFAIKCVKTGVVINDQQNIGTRRDTLIDGATSREGQKGFDS